MWRRGTVLTAGPPAERRNHREPQRLQRFMRRPGRKSGKERQTEGGSRRLLSKEETGSSEKTEKKRKEKGQEVSAGVSGGEQPCRTRLKTRLFA